MINLDCESNTKSRSKTSPERLPKDVATFLFRSEKLYLKDKVDPDGRSMAHNANYVHISCFES